MKKLHRGLGAVLPMLAVMAGGWQVAEAQTIEFVTEPREPVSTEVERDGDVWRAGSDEFAVTFPSSAGAPVRVAAERHQPLTMRSLALTARTADGDVVWRDDARDVEASVEGNVVRYAQRFAGADEEYTAYDIMLKHDAVVPAPVNLSGAAWLGLESEVVLPDGYTAQPQWLGSDERQRAFAVDIYNADGALAYQLMEVHAADAAGDRVDGHYRVIEVGDGRVVVAAEFPANWLQAAAYPVRLDPTVTYDSGVTLSHASPFHQIGTGGWVEGSGMIWWSPSLFQSQNPPAGNIMGMSLQANGVGNYNFTRLVIEIRESTMTYTANWSTSYATALNSGAPAVIAFDGAWEFNSTAAGDWVDIPFTTPYEYSGNNGICVVFRLQGGSGTGTGNIRYGSAGFYNEGAHLFTSNFNATSSGGNIGLTAHARFNISLLDSPTETDLGDLYVGDPINVPFIPFPGATLTITPVSTLPDGVSWDAANDTLTGTVAASTAGTTVTVDIEVDDGGGSEIVTLTWDAHHYPDVTMGNQVAVTGAAFSATPQVSGGVAPFVWQVPGLPGWLTYDPSNGQISGTPTAADLGSHSLFANAIDANGKIGTAVFELEVREPVAISGTELPAATEGGNAHAIMIPITGGSANLSFSATGLPAGLSVDVSTGIISGTPQTGTADSSPYTVSVSVTDLGAGGGPVTADLDMVVAPAPVITTQQLARATINSHYFQPLIIEGGVGPFTVVVNGLPDSFMALADPLMIFGEPTVTDLGGYEITIEVTDANGGFTEAGPMILTVVRPVSDDGNCGMVAGGGSVLGLLAGLGLLALIGRRTRRVGIVASN